MNFLSNSPKVIQREAAKQKQLDRQHALQQYASSSAAGAGHGLGGGGGMGDASSSAIDLGRSAF